MVGVKCNPVVGYSQYEHDGGGGGAAAEGINAVLNTDDVINTVLHTAIGKLGREEQRLLPWGRAGR